jgi:hypothetical protein
MKLLALGSVVPRGDGPKHRLGQAPPTELG